MSRFNTSTSVRTKTENLAGGEAYIENPLLKVVYRSGNAVVFKVNLQAFTEKAE